MTSTSAQTPEQLQQEIARLTALLGQRDNTIQNLQHHVLSLAGKKHESSMNQWATSRPVLIFCPVRSTIIVLPTP